MLHIEIRDTESGEVHFDNDVSKLCCMVVEKDGKTLDELVMNASLLDVAAMLSSTKKVKHAAALASTMAKIMESERGDAESALFAEIMGGTDNGKNLQ